MKVYLAGPMSGIQHFNFPAFDRAELWLREQGHEVFSPAQDDRDNHGQDFAQRNPEGSQEEAKKQGFNLRDALCRDIGYICASADAIALLPGWQNSKGVAAELATAKALDLVIIHIPVCVAEGTTSWPKL